MFSNLSGGMYTVTVFDNNGCINTDSFSIIHPDSVAILSVTSINESCSGANDGYIQDITASGGYPPYTYMLDGGPQHSSWLCDSLNPGCPTGYVFANL